MSKTGSSSSTPYPSKSFGGGGGSSKSGQSDGPFVYKAKGSTKFKPKKLAVSKAAKGDQGEYEKAMKEYKRELGQKSSSSKNRNFDEKPSSQKTEVVERKIEIDRAEDEEDAETSLRSVRELAHARYLRNHRLINEIFSADVVFPTRPITSQTHLDNLKATVQRLTTHREKLVSDIDKMEEKFQAKKQSVLEAIELIMRMNKKDEIEASVAQRHFQSPSSSSPASPAVLQSAGSVPPMNDSANNSAAPSPAPAGLASASLGTPLAPQEQQVDAHEVPMETDDSYEQKTETLEVRGPNIQHAGEEQNGQSNHESAFHAGTDVAAEEHQELGAQQHFQPQEGHEHEQELPQHSADSDSQDSQDTQEQVQMGSLEQPEPQHQETMDQGLDGGESHVGEYQAPQPAEHQ